VGKKYNKPPHLFLYEGYFFTGKICTYKKWACQKKQQKTKTKTKN
jgi:hypothetical protein